VHGASSQSSTFDGNFIAALEEFDRVSKLPVGTTPFEAINFWSTNSWALWFLGYPERAQASNRKSLAIGREVTASLGDLALALTLSAFFSLLLRDPKTAASHSDEAVVVAEIVNPDIEFLSQGRARVTHSYLRL
jgi:hypothetical protein